MTKKKEMPLTPSNLQEAYDIISAACALGIELPAPAQTVVYEANARSKNIELAQDVVFDQHLGLYSSFTSAMLALGGYALDGLSKSGNKPWLPNVIPGIIFKSEQISEAEEKVLKSEWLKDKTVHQIILHYYADYAVAKRTVDSEPYDQMSILHNAELGI